MMTAEEGGLTTIPNEKRHIGLLAPNLNHIFSIENTARGVDVSTESGVTTLRIDFHIDQPSTIQHPRKLVRKLYNH